jgi:nitric oxide dioxygenase
LRAMDIPETRIHYEVFGPDLFEEYKPRLIE